MNFGNLVVDIVKSVNPNNPNLVAQKITVTKDGKTFQQTFWVDPSADPKSDDYKRKKLEHHLSNGNKNDAVQTAKELGIQWKEHNHSGINWMRASMAMKNHLSQHSNQAQPQQASQQPTATQTQQPHPAQHDNKFSLKTFEALKNDKAEAMKYLKQVGITWQEHSHEGVNWMRATMAAKKAAVGSGQMQTMQQQPQVTQGKSDTQKIAERPKIAEQPKEVVDNRTLRQKKIDALLEELDENARKQARQCGMIAGNKEAQPYLDQLFYKYKKLSGAGGLNYAADAHAQTKQQIMSSKDPKLAAARQAAGGIINRMLLDNMKSYVDKMTKNDDIGNYVRVNDIFSSWRYQGANGSPVKSLKMGEQPPPEMANDFTGLLTALDRIKEFGGHSDEVIKELSDDIQNVIEVAKNDKHWNKEMNDAKIHSEEWLKDRLKQLDERGSVSSWKGTDLRKDAAEHAQNMIINAGARLRRAASEGEYLEAKKVIMSKADKNPEYRDAVKNLYHMYEANKNMAKMGWVIPHAYKHVVPMDTDELKKLSKPMTDDEKRDFLMDKAMDIMTLKNNNRNSSKSPDDIKKDMKRQLDKAIKDIMGDYNVSEDDLLKAGDISCVISKADSKVTSRIMQKISADWDSKHHGSMHPKILGVYEISDLPVEEEYSKIKAANEKKHGAANTRQFYHGTGTFATTLILGKSGQFKVGKAKVGRMLGNGIYLADKSSKSAQYMSDDSFTRSGTTGSLMICEASLGTKSSNMSTSADTVEAVAGTGRWAFLSNSEWCVKDPKAVLPKYLVHMELL